VRWPPRALAVRDYNTVSAVLRVRWRDRELWFMGDALALQEQDLLDLGDPGPPDLGDLGPRDLGGPGPPDLGGLGPPDLGGLGPRGPGRLLKAGHHGSRSASQPAWVQALAPAVALVSAGRRNAFEHPHPEAMAALEGQALTFVTGACQGVRVAASGTGWAITTGAGRQFFLQACSNSP
jgi:competence protein ComEC